MKKNKRLLSLVLAVFMLFTSPTYFYDPVEVNAASTTRASVQVKNQTKSVIRQIKHCLFRHIKIGLL